MQMAPQGLHWLAACHVIARTTSAANFLKAWQGMLLQIYAMAWKYFPLLLLAF